MVPAEDSAAILVPGSPSALDSQARIDKEIAELNQAIYKLQIQMKPLCAQRNKLSLIYRLPSEILSTIFVQCAQDWHHETAIDAVRSVPDWVNTSYVCRQWRDIALECPVLWSHFFMVSTPWVEELLLRSEPAPLKIRFNLEWTQSESWAIRRLKKVAAQLWRIQEIELMLECQAPGDIISVFSASPAPLLKSLDILAHSSASPIGPFFDGVAPALCRLKLFHCPMPRSIPKVDSLTTLILEDVEHFTMADLRAVLGSMQRLIHLELLNALELPHTEQNVHSSDAWETLQVPHLLRLAVDESSLCVIHLLSWLDIPSQTKVRIRTSELNPEIWLTLRSLFVDKFFTFRDNSTPYVRTWGVDLESRNVEFIASKSDDVGSTRRFRHRQWDWDCNIPLKLNVSLYHPKLSAQDVIRDVTQDARHSGFLTGLRGVHVSFYWFDREKSDWPLSEDMLALIPELSRTIEVYGARRSDGPVDSLRSLVSFLSLTQVHHHAERYQNTPLGRPSEKMLASRLEELVISDSAFDHWATEPEQHHTVQVANLYEALALRKRNGYDLNRLTLTKCFNMFKEDVVKLKEVVGEVVWDGCEREV